MDNLDINTILNRKYIETDFKKKIINFEENKDDLTLKRGFFFYGNSGVGKTYFVKKILKELNYDVITYDSGDIRNKSVIEGITKYSMNDKNILSMFTKTPQKICIIMDEIDGMNSGDKGGLSSLIKLVREKKTKKQKNEQYSVNPIICIGNYHFDKKLTELKKVCHSYELKEPSKEEVRNIINKIMPKLDNETEKNMINYVNGDLRKVITCNCIYTNQKGKISDKLINEIFQTKINNEFSKDLTKHIINKRIPINDHTTLINETDRTSISLLFHENIIDVVPKDKTGFNYYKDVLDSYCYADYLDRITFQKQIWIFNELTSIMKTIKSNNDYHDNIPKNKQNKLNDKVRFTKILTKYSTEYNNLLFINNLCCQLQMDRSDLIYYFISKKKIYNSHPQKIYNEFSEHDISKLDIDRIYRFIK